MNATESLSVVRRSIFPDINDTWETIATRELSDVDLAEAVSQLQSWNLHVFMRRVAGKDSHEQTSHILPSDVIFVEPPLA